MATSRQRSVIKQEITIMHRNTVILLTPCWLEYSFSSLKSQDCMNCGLKELVLNCWLYLQIMHPKILINLGLKSPNPAGCSASCRMNTYTLCSVFKTIYQSKLPDLSLFVVLSDPLLDISWMHPLIEVSVEFPQYLYNSDSNSKSVAPSCCI